AVTRTFSGTPGNDDVGAINISVIATDPDGTSAVTSFTLTVLNVNDAPTVGNYSHAIDEDTQASGQVIGDDIDGDDLGYTLADAAANGIAVVNPDGSYTYTPDAD